jgi:hypothetical protein
VQANFEGNWLETPKINHPI